jgi:methylenetetrahydrofolate dehydrogenase (NADP+)/methenyltetrahydrofolate cyclohydrolase
MTATTARLLDGKALSQTVLSRLGAEVPELARALGRPPGLAVILAGDDHASQIYVRNKVRAAEKLGIASRSIRLPAETSAERLAAELEALNADPAIDGILLQLPLPKHLDPQRHIESILPSKDVDGFHPINIGRAALGLPAFQPCTPLGIRELLAANGIETVGRHVVIAGRGQLVGLPLSRLIIQRGPGGDATVTICHTRTPDLAAHVRQADIVIGAAGKAHLITRDMIKPGAAVIDAGINRIDDPASPQGYKIVGDADFEGVSQVAGAITPVPGGVGPMTVAMLMSNALQAARGTLRGG